MVLICGTCLVDAVQQFRCKVLSDSLHHTVFHQLPTNFTIVLLIAHARKHLSFQIKPTRNKRSAYVSTL